MIERRTGDGNDTWYAEVLLERVAPETTSVLWSVLKLGVISVDNISFERTLLLSTQILPLNATNRTDAPVPTVTWYRPLLQDGAIRAGDIIRIEGMNRSFEGSEMYLSRMDGEVGWPLTNWTLPIQFP